MLPILPTGHGEARGDCSEGVCSRKLALATRRPTRLRFCGPKGPQAGRGSARRLLGRAGLLPLGLREYDEDSL